jgi:hypothetical protein
LKHAITNRLQPIYTTETRSFFHHGHDMDHYDLRRLLATTDAQHSRLAKAGQPSQTSLKKFH